MLTFPSTCVAIFHPGEQPMKLVQNCNIIENKLRLYRDQVHDNNLQGFFIFDGLRIQEQTFPIDNHSTVLMNF